MNCPICHDIIIDEAYARCEWCRIGAPMEAALEGVEWKTFGVTTGRTSSSKPNLVFARPVTSEGKPVREAFTGPRGFILFDFDFAAAERRLLNSLLLPAEFTRGR
jgi:hypothetical protein